MGMKSILVSLSAAIALAGCTKHVSIQAQFNGKEVYRCPNAEVGKLSPADGGFRFFCSDGSSVYVIYDTSVNKDGTVASVELAGAQSRTFLPAVFSTKRGNEDCAQAKALNRETGEAPLRTSAFGNPVSGTYDWVMAKPCGSLTLTVAEPVK